MSAARFTERTFILRHPGRWLLAGTMVAVMIVIGLVCYSLHYSYQQSRNAARLSSANLSHVLQESLEGRFEKIDAVLFAAKQEIERQLAAGGIKPTLLNAWLDRQYKHMQESDSLRMADEHGNIRYGTGVPTGGGANLSDRDYFRRLRDNPSAHLAISDPLVGRTSGKKVLVLAMRINYENGKFAGVIYAPVPLAEIAATFSHVDVGKRGAIFVRKSSGDYRLIARHPETIGDTGVSAIGHAQPVQELIAFAQSGKSSLITEFRSALDGIDRTYALRQLGDLNYLFGVGIARDDYLADWRQEVVIQSGLAALFVAIICLGAMAIYRGQRRRQEVLQALADEETKLRTIADYTYNWESWIDGNGKLLWVSPAVKDVTGYSAEECMAMPDYPMSIIHPEDRETTLQSLNATTTPEGPPRHRHFRILRKDGAVRICERYWRTLYDQQGNAAGNRNQMRDVTDQMQAQQELIAARATAELASKAKGEFLANMSHEIRTPMNAIIGLSTLALGQQAPPLIHDYLAKINSSSRALLNILNDILDYSKIEAGRLEIEHIPFSLDDVLGNVANLFAQGAEEKGLSFKFSIAPDVPFQLVGDPLRLGQVMNNLVGNAIKFTPSGEVRVDVSTLESDAGVATLRFSVADTGIGISQEQSAQIFSPFTQGEGAGTRRFSGAGLGLSISQQLVGFMGGKIHVESEPGKGSTFSFDLRFPVPDGENDAARGQETIGGLPQTTETLRGAHILLVEDNAINQQVAQEMLARAGFAVTTVENGEMALDALGQRHFDAVLMDLQLPVLDGFETTRRIRANPQWKTLPVIAMTAAVMPHERQECLDAGMNDHVGKPVDPHALLAALEKWIAPGHRALARYVSPLAQTDWPPALAGFDLRALDSRIGGNRELLLSLLGQFALNFSDSANRLDKLIGIDRLQDAAALAHQIKGAAGNLGANEIQRLASHLEETLKKGQRPTSLNPLTFALDHAIAAIAALERHAPMFRSSVPHVCDVRQAGDAYLRLKALLDNNDFVPHELLTEFKAALPCGPDCPNLIELERHIDNIDYPGAQALLARLQTVPPEDTA